MAALAKMAQTRSDAREISSGILRTLAELIKPNSPDTVLFQQELLEEVRNNVCTKINETDTKDGYTSGISSTTWSLLQCVPLSKEGFLKRSVQKDLAKTPRW